MYDMVSHCNRFANAAGPGRGVGVDPKALELASGPKRVAERGAPPTQNASDLGDLGWRIKYMFLYKGSRLAERRASCRARRVRFARGSPGRRAACRVRRSFWIKILQNDGVGVGPGLPIPHIYPMLE